MEGKRKNNAKFSGHYVRPRRHNVSLRFAPVPWPPSDLDVEKYVHGRKKKNKNNAKFRGHYVHPNNMRARTPFAPKVPYL